MRCASLWLTGALVAVSSVATAQTRPASPEASAWEVGGYGGVVSTGRASGSASPPPTGAPILTSSPVFPSREVSSWWIGDGAVLLNDVLAEFSLAPRLTPLDRALDAIGGDRSVGAAVGAFVRRRVSRRAAVEFRVDLLPEGSLSGATTESIEASRATFESAFGALFATGPFSNVSVTALSSVDDGSPRSAAFTGALLFEFGAWGSFAPYVAMGGGVIKGAGTPAVVTLEGDYRFTLLDGSRFDESDFVTLESSTRTVPVGLLGAGVRRPVSERWGLQFDGRVLIGPSATKVTLNASPAVQSGTPPSFIESFTYPSVQFSNAPSTGRVSTLSGPNLQGMNFFAGRGVETRVLLTVGVYARF